MPLLLLRCLHACLSLGYAMLRNFKRVAVSFSLAFNLVHAMAQDKWQGFREHVGDGGPDFWQDPPHQYHLPPQHTYYIRLYIVHVIHKIETYSFEA